MNLPNKITLVRILLIPVIIFFFFASFIPYGINYFVCAIIFVLAAYTDALDGYIARKYNLVTSIGKFLDAIADKLLATVALILIVCSNILNWKIGAGILIIIVSRDLIVDMLRQVASSKNVIIAADWFGKIKTIIIDIALPILLIVPGLISLNVGGVAYDIVYYTGLVLLLLSTLLSVLSAINYIVKNKAVLKD